MPWAPDDVEAVCSWLAPMYQRWLAADARNDARCRQLRLEDLAQDWPGQRSALFAWLGLPDTETELEMTPDRLAHWQPLSAADEARARARLDFAMDAFGYT
jgi:hypothetical protein